MDTKTRKLWTGYCDAKFRLRYPNASIEIRASFVAACDLKTCMTPAGAFNQMELDRRITAILSNWDAIVATVRNSDQNGPD